MDSLLLYFNNLYLRAYLLPWTGEPLGPVTWAASGPLVPMMTMNSTLSPSPTLRKYFLGLFFMMAVYRRSSQKYLLSVNILSVT